MSSHREAPAISQDPVADNADTYAFVSPEDPSTVTIITNYVPLEGPPGGPNFFEFGDDVLYSIFIDNDGDAYPDVTYQFRFRTTLQNLHLIPTPAAPSVDPLKSLNIHTIAIKVPIGKLTRGHSVPSDPAGAG